MTAPVTAYCGTPAIPAEVWTSWNLDPVVMVALVGLAVTSGCAPPAQPGASEQDGSVYVWLG